MMIMYYIFEKQGKPYERKIGMTFVEIATKAGWFSLKALQKPFKKRLNHDNTKFCDKIANVSNVVS